MRIQINNLDIEYTDRGTGPVLLFLHGWAAPLAAYEPVFRALEKKYRVVAPQYPGSGTSQEPAAPWKLEDYGHFVLQFCKALAIAPEVLMGHSHGGRVSLWLLGSGLLQPRKCVLMDAAGVPAKKTAKQKLTLRLYKCCKWLGTNRLTAPFFGDLYREMRDKRSSADYKAASPVMRGTLSNVIPCDLRPLMPAIQTDTLLLWGEHDTATPLSDAQQMEQRMPKAGLAVVKGAGHFPYVDNPAQFFAILGCYLEV